MSELETPVGNRTAAEVISDAVAESGTQWKRWTVGQRSDRPENACDTVMAALDTAGFAVVPVAERDAAVARVAVLEARHQALLDAIGDPSQLSEAARALGAWYPTDQGWSTYLRGIVFAVTSAGAPETPGSVRDRRGETP